MNGITRKIVAIMMLCTVITVVIVGILSVRTANKIVDENSEQRLALLCENSTQKINAMIDSLEQSVDVLANYALDSLDDPARFRTDSAYVSAYTEKIRTLFTTMAVKTNGAMSVYIRYNPEFTDPTSGLFIVYNHSAFRFEEQTPTDFSIYDQGDTNHVGWYYTPVSNGGPTWMPPYENKNISAYMISYVVPLYLNGTCYGVVGMDIDFDLLRSMVKKINIYDTGYAFLVDDQQNIMIYPDISIYTPIEDIENGSMQNLFTTQNVGRNDIRYKYDGKTMSASVQQLNNGMILVLSAPVSEIYSDSTVLTLRIILVSLGSLAVVLLTAALVVSRMLKPVTTDALTGINNRQNFFLLVRDRLAKKSGVPYAFIMFDIDHFKQINDSQGHAAGDDAIKQIAANLNRILPNEDIIGRFGGDEFMVFMQCDKKEIALRRIEQFREMLLGGGNIYSGSMTCSIGIVFTDDYSTNPETLLKNADVALYQAKQNGRDLYVFFGEEA